MGSVRRILGTDITLPLSRIFAVAAVPHGTFPPHVLIQTRPGIAVSLLCLSPLPDYISSRPCLSLGLDVPFPALSHWSHARYDAGNMASKNPNAAEKARHIEGSIQTYTATNKRSQ